MNENSKAKRALKWVPTMEKVSRLLAQLEASNRDAPKNVRDAAKRVSEAGIEGRPSAEDLGILLLWQLETKKPRRNIKDQSKQPQKTQKKQAKPRETAFSKRIQEGEEGDQAWRLRKRLRTGTVFGKKLKIKGDPQG